MFTPAKLSYIILFITKEQQQALTQYKDYFDGDLLHIDGEATRGSSLKRVLTQARTWSAIAFTKDFKCSIHGLSI